MNVLLEAEELHAEERLILYLCWQYPTQEAIIPWKSTVQG